MYYNFLQAQINDKHKVKDKAGWTTKLFEEVKPKRKTFIPLPQLSIILLM